MKSLIDELKENTKITIKSMTYLVKTKTWYSIEEDKETSYVKCELSNHKVLVLIPEDNLIYLGEVIEDMKYEKIGEETIRYLNQDFHKTGEGHQFIKKIEFGKKEEVEGRCIFEDYEAEDKIVSLGVLTEKEKRADIYADILKIEDIVVIK